MPASRSSLPPSPLVPQADKSGSANDAHMRAAIDAAITKALVDLGLDDADAPPRD